ncbi:dihydroxyacetone kinase subunit DhaL [Streptomyces sp. NPDC002055]|uniref:dihydroxyacetone kinase subunit DhaL n=1 Tax=Streptomyces sp. NPDC002055 TaxID=3154534 RepID=UPI00331A745A
MTDPTGPASAVLDTAFFLRWLDRATKVITEQAAQLTELDSAIGDADHGANLKRGFTSALAVVTAEPPGSPGALLKAFGTHLTNTVGGASGPLYGTVLRRAGRVLGDEDPVTPEALGEALAAAVAGVRRLGDSGPGDKTMVDALAPAAEAYSVALGGGAEVPQALAAASQAAREGAEATVPLQARRGRASYLGERSIGHKDPGAASSALLITALYDVTATAGDEPAAPSGTGAVTGTAEAGAAEAAGGAEETDDEEGAQPAATGTAAMVGVALVSHSRDVAAATAELAKALVGSGTPAPIGVAGGVEDGGIGTSATLIRDAIKHADAGRGVVVICDMGSAVLTVKALLAETGAAALPEGVRIADAPFVEGAVAALVTASAGADLDLVLSATDDARNYHKI